jgi:enolase
MTDTTIAFVHARRVWDSRGRPTVEADVLLEGGAVGRAIAPAGASTGSGEALDLRDGGTAFGGYDVRKAVANVNDIIAPCGHRDRCRGSGSAGRAADRAGWDPQQDAPRRQCDAGGIHGRRPCRRRGNRPAACIAISAAPDAMQMPLPQIQIFGGGAHAGRRVDIQDFMVMCPGAESFAQALDWTAEIYRTAGKLMEEAGSLAGVADEGGWWPAFPSNEQALDTLVAAIERTGLRPVEQVGIALDVAASEFGRNGRYKLALDGKGAFHRRHDRAPDRLAGTLSDPVDRGSAGGGRCGRICRPSPAPSAAGTDRRRRFPGQRRRSAAGCGGEGSGEYGAAEAEPARHPDRDLRHRRVAGECGYATIVSARSGETEDVTIAHLAVGWNAGQLKVGSFSRGERMAKWNEMLRIEEALGGKARFAGGSVLGRSSR